MNSTNKYIISCRLTRNQALILINLIKDDMRNKYASGIPPETQILIGLQFLARGEYQTSVALNWHHPVCQATVSKIIKKMVNAVEQLIPYYIQYPSTQRARRIMSDKFFDYCWLPNILSIMDGTIIRLKKPCQHEEAYYSYKGVHCLNVQIVNTNKLSLNNFNYNIIIFTIYKFIQTCDPNCIVTSFKIVPGSNNDQFTWNKSFIKQYMESLYLNQEVRQQEGTYYIMGI